MKLLHLTPKRNYKSILKYGLMPSKVNLEHHLEAFQLDGLVGDKANYLWDPNQSGDTDKMIQDFIYCKHFIHPRNELAIRHELLDLPDIDFEKMGSKLFGNAEDYVLLEIDTKTIDLLCSEYVHEQSSDGNKWSTCTVMNSKYEHNDKVLHITNDIIRGSEIKLINEISTRFHKDDTIGVTYKR
jgi:hypothetical protein